MDQNFEARIAAALAKSKTFIEELTVHSSVNRPGPVVTGDNMFFSWIMSIAARKTALLTCIPGATTTALSSRV